MAMLNNQVGYIYIIPVAVFFHGPLTVPGQTIRALRRYRGTVGGRASRIEFSAPWADENVRSLRTNKPNKVVPP